MVILIGCIALGVIGICYFCFYYQKQEQLIKYLRLKWGQEITRDYTYNEFENIKMYWELKSKIALEEEGSSYIDELTWNDLDMDEVFTRISHTESIIGESYLYDRLHYLHFDVKELEEFEKYVNVMDENETIRLSIQSRLSQFDKGTWNGIPLYLFKVDEKSSYYKPIYGMMGILPIISLLSLLSDVKLGMLLVVAMMVVNGCIHYKYARSLSYEMDGLNAVYLLLKCAKKISMLQEDSLSPICRELKENCSKLESILSLEGRFFLSTNTDLGILQEYLGIITLSHLRIHHKFLTLLKKETKALQNIYAILGMLESSIAVASYRRSVDYWCTPTFGTDKTLEVEELYHPLIEDPVSHSVKLTKNAIITGSNASGKSTFVKSLAINGILGQSIHTVLAERFVAPLSYYMTSMAISDNILTDESYYIAEIRSLKRIIDAIQHYPFCICFIDEILKGTNTIERIAASSAILKHLNTLNCLCLSASHDIELTQMLENSYHNYHFREIIEDSQIKFDYKIYKGPSTTRNAIKLLEVMNYDESIIYDANHLASYFSTHQIWLKL
nr:hypothetical protein [uncultured Niameybacter sp.]